jgi:hypothetical protein
VTQIFHFICGGFPGSIAELSLVAGLKRIFGPAIVQILVNAFFVAKPSNPVFTAKSFKNYADLLFG